ncbi:hypothetical protein CC1G_13248 [Coprinopsis cinerea okayama7|uniref:Uncharacterized protein n=1 Tax=Coprinopsis cinerea (strain Okayama-7 / 130 / ATCC MYA-4618 / FGSC 9003) TaxID=240176 RepID=A8PI47_COPC7|nr:hypothetical protein CC1G_13248 [Coprinopsis cinerea okayama7\|eukprot:XP_001841516.2 hypothetical protein CC1G_13248 [Coprinopsis cinerea okayama7\
MPLLPGEWSTTPKVSRGTKSKFAFSHFLNPILFSNATTTTSTITHGPGPVYIIAAANVNMGTIYVEQEAATAPSIIATKLSLDAEPLIARRR